MRSLAQMVDTYKRKLELFWKDVPSKPDIDSMVTYYREKVTDLREKLMLAKDVCNEAGITGPKQANFFVLTNRFWRLTEVMDYGGDACALEFKIAIALFTVKFAWVSADILVAKDIAVRVFSVTPAV